MASLSYLWTNRAKFSLKSKSFYVAWAKRLLLIPALLKRNRNRNTLLRKGATIHQLAEIGNVTIEGNRSNLTIGAESFLGQVKVALHDQVLIGKRVCINDGVELLTASHDIFDPKWRHVKKKIVINDYAWIGTGAMILPGVTIGRGAVVGARAVVSKDVSDYAIVVGVPATPIVKTRTSDLDYNPCEFLAENRAWLIG